VVKGDLQWMDARVVRVCVILCIPSASLVYRCICTNRDPLQSTVCLKFGRMIYLLARNAPGCLPDSRDTHGYFVLMCFKGPLSCTKLFA